MRKRQASFSVDRLEDRFLLSIATTTTVVKIPGPTDAVVTTATNPGGNHPPGHQNVTLVKNNQA